MDRNNEQHDADVIDLGAVTRETKGGAKGDNDFMGGLRQGTGLSDD